MSATIYNKAFAVELSHDFYVTENKFNVNTDFEIAPADSTTELFGKGRMKFIRNRSGFLVFYKSYVDSTPPPPPVEKPLVKLSGDTEFLFVMNLRQDAATSVLNVTDLDQGGSYSAGKIFFLDATAGSSTPSTIGFTPSLIDQLRPSSFTYSFLPSPATVNNLTVKVYPEDSVTAIITINNVEVDPSTGRYSVEIDLSGESNGIYTIEAKDGGTTVNSATLYVDSTLAKEKVFGLMRIKYAAANIDRLYDSCGTKTDFFTFNYAFDVRYTTWRYYIISNTVDTSSFDLAVKDDQDTPVYTFNAVDPSTQPWGQPTSLMTINGVSPVIVESTVPIPFSETALSTLAIFKRAVGGSGGGTKVTSPISNARVDGVDSDQLGAAQTPPTITADISEIFVIV